MGIPAITWFCENGHIVLDVPHHYMAEDPERCHFCGSKKLAYEFEWHDSDCGETIVPHEPIGIERKRKTVKMAVYDVRKLFRRRRI